MSPAWAFALGPPAPLGGMNWELTKAKARKCTFRLSGNDEVSFTLDGRHPDAMKIDELRTDLHVMRAQTPDSTKQRLFRGRIGPTGDTVSEDAHAVSCTALDYRAMLQRRILYSDSTLTWTLTEQALIAWGLVQQTQARAGGNLGIVQGSGTSTGQARDRTYEAGDNIGQRLQELSEVENGFDWDISTPTASSLVLDLWPLRGEDRGVVLEYGGIADTVTRTVDTAEYANAGRLTGNAPEGSSDPPAPVEVEADDIADRPEGRWDKTYGTSIVLEDSLTERADWQLADAEVIRPAYTVRINTWRGPDHIWKGDLVRLIVKSGRLQVDTYLRVMELGVDISDDGDESVTLSLGRPRPDFTKRAVAMERRLADLERR